MSHGTMTHARALRAPRATVGARIARAATMRATMTAVPMRSRRAQAVVCAAEPPRDGAYGRGRGRGQGTFCVAMRDGVVASDANDVRGRSRDASA